MKDDSDNKIQFDLSKTSDSHKNYEGGWVYRCTVRGTYSINLPKVMADAYGVPETVIFEAEVGDELIVEQAITMFKEQLSKKE